MSKYNMFRFTCLVVLWLSLCYLLVKGRGLDGITVFAVIASGIIVFVPLYKKYIRKK